MQGGRYQPARRPAPSRRRTPEAGASACRVWCSGVAVALLLFLVGYPLLWLILPPSACRGNSASSILCAPLPVRRTTARSINTLQLALGTGVMSILIGVPLAWATARSDMPLRKVVHALVALSYITPPYLTALAYIILLGPDAGQFNRLLRMFSSFESGPINIFSMAWRDLRDRHPCLCLHLFSHLQRAPKSVDASLEESAQMLGARRWQTTLRINLPLVAPAITGGALLAAIDSLALFGPQAIIGTPAQIVFLPTRIYATIGSYPPRWAEASALSLVLVAADGYRACRAARLSGASLLRHGRRTRRAHEPNFASAPGAGRCLPSAYGGVFQRRCAHRRACVDCVLQELDRSSVAVATSRSRISPRPLL